MTVHVINQHPDIDAINEASCTRTGEYLLDVTGRNEFQFSIVLTSDDAVRELNHRYRHRDTPTNVLSFPFACDDEPFQTLIGSSELGDIVVSCDRAAVEAREQGCSLQTRLNWLIVHGYLHLLGYDHETSEEDAEIMFRKERELLASLPSD